MTSRRRKTPLPPMRRVSRQQWWEAGTQLYGEDPRRWRFRCVQCGHVQSHAEVKERNPKVGDTSNWIFFSCEGRINPDVGCDWTLGGLLHIHTLEVACSDGKIIPAFEFAAASLLGEQPYQKHATQARKEDPDAPVST